MSNSVHTSVPAPSRRPALGPRWLSAFSACSPRMLLFEQETSRSVKHNTPRYIDRQPNDELITRNDPAVVDKEQ